MVKRGKQDAKGKGMSDTKMNPKSKNDKGMSAEGAKKFGEAIGGNVTGRTVPKTKGDK
jgi:hypothetical protein